jgi:Ca2+-binding EF-hand superfamily protein
MNRLLTPGLCALALLFGVALLVSAQVVPIAVNQPAPAAAANVSDTQTLVYLGETRPMLLRMHVLIDGKPYPAAWDAFMKKMFDYADVNGDGTLDKAEAARVLTVSFLRIHYQGAIGILDNPGNIAPFAELDANKDGKVTFDEFKAYYRKTGFGSFQMRGGSAQGKSGQLTDALFKALDRNHDGKLSREELATADEALHPLDLDEDEMISEDELVPNSNPYAGVFFAGGDMGGPASTAFQLVTPGEAPSALIKALLNQYDKDKNGKLSRAESGFDAATFARVDTNKDGQLDAGELAKWLAGPSDLELTVRLGQQPARRQPGGLLKGVVDANRGNTSEAPVEVTPGKEWPLAGLAHVQGEGVVIGHGIAQIDVRGDNAGRFFGDGARGFYVQQFNQALKDKKDYLTKAEADNVQFLRGLFALADRDGDGKLTLKELNAFFEALSGGANAFATLTVNDHGTGLFELIDSNRDGRLSIRELRTAWERIAPWDKAGTGAVSRDQIPRQYKLSVRQGPPDDGRFRRVVRNPGMVRANSSPGRGPLWFRKMDRNGDGDVSRREWLGSLEDFKKIDTDGDGLISAEEAEKADAWFREKMKDNKK